MTVEALLAELHAASPAPGRDALVAAAEALAAGEPKRAERVLAGAAESELAPALRLAARTLDRNRYPGGAGAVMAPEDYESLATEPPPPGDPAARLTWCVATRLIPLVQTATRIAEDSRGLPDPRAAIDLILEAFGSLESELRGLGGTVAVDALRCAHADVLHRAGLRDDAAALLAGDESPWATLLRGDWALEPDAPPETLGVALVAAAVAHAGAGADPNAAERLYAAADAAFAATDGDFAAGAAVRGRAAVALRRAHAARRAGDPQRCAAYRDEAAALARRAGDQSTGWLLEVHGTIDRLAAGEDVAPDALDALAGWVARDGPTGFGRGVVRLLLAQARRWRETSRLPAAMRGLRLARRLAGAIDDAGERDLAERAYVDAIDSTNFRRASAVMLAADAAEAVTRLRGGAAVDALEWLKAADVALGLDRAAEVMADPQVKGIAGARLHDLLELAPPEVASPDSVFHPAFAALTEAAARSEPLRLRYEGRRLEAAGHLDESRRLIGRALELTAESGDDFLHAVLLADLGRDAEALPLVRRLWRSGSLHHDHAAELFVQLGDAESAAAALAALDESGWQPSADRPWVEPARRAELALLRGHYADARRLADAASEAFEAHQAQLVRDILRTAAADDITVAAMYHVAMMARLGVANEDGDAAAAGAFAVAERGRGLVLSLLADLAALPPGEAREAARRWLRAGSAWAAAYEGLLGEVVRAPEVTPSSALLRERVLAADDALYDAETAVAALAPQLLGGRHSRPADLGLDEVRAALKPDALLLLYQAFDDDLVLWAVDRGGARVQRTAVRTRELASLARRFHDGCAGARAADDAGAALAELLLEPVRTRVDSHARVLIVPHRALALIPFGLLPFGDGLLCDGRTLSYLPSAALLLRDAAGRPPRLDAPALLVGDPAYAPARRLPRLPGTATEVLTIARLLGTPDPLVAAAASEAAVTASAPDRPLLHLATHGLVDERAPNASFVALAGTDELTVGDIAGLDLAADLMVLSACHTGKGTATAAGDIVGLVRAGLAAGARHLVVSLWPVDDEAGCLLMTAFYEALLAGAGVADALSEAQGSVRRLGAGERAAAYAALCERSGTAPAAPHARDVDPDSGSAPLPASERAASIWAPFIHVGAQ